MRASFTTHAAMQRSEARLRAAVHIVRPFRCTAGSAMAFGCVQPGRLWIAQKRSWQSCARCGFRVPALDSSIHIWHSFARGTCTAGSAVHCSAAQLAQLCTSGLPGPAPQLRPETAVGSGDVREHEKGKGRQRKAKEGRGPPGRAKEGQGKPGRAKEGRGGPRMPRTARDSQGSPGKTRGGLGGPRRPRKR